MTAPSPARVLSGAAGVARAAPRGVTLSDVLPPVACENGNRFEEYLEPG